MLNPEKLITRLIFHSDAGHGWLAVPEHLVKSVGYVPTVYSYYSPKKKMIYLEEDCDATSFLKLAEEKGLKFEIVDQDDGNTSPIRRLERAG